MTVRMLDAVEICALVLERQECDTGRGCASGCGNEPNPKSDGMVLPLMQENDTYDQTCTQKRL